MAGSDAAVAAHQASQARSHEEEWSHEKERMAWLGWSCVCFLGAHGGDASWVGGGVAAVRRVAASALPASAASLQHPC